MSKAPFTMYVKSVKIQPMYPGYAYNYTNLHSSWPGQWTDVKILNTTTNPSSGTASSSSQTKTSTTIRPILNPSGVTSTTTSGASIPTNPFNAATLPNSTASGSTTSIGPSRTYVTSTTVTPTPIQSNMISSCNAFYQAVAGDDCATIAQKCGISEGDFKAWNPDVGPQCWNLWLNYYSCVGIGNGLVSSNSALNASSILPISSSVTTSPSLTQTSDATTSMNTLDSSQGASTLVANTSSIISTSSIILSDFSGISSSSIRPEPTQIPSSYTLTAPLSTGLGAVIIASSTNRPMPGTGMIPSTTASLTSQSSVTSTLTLQSATSSAAVELSSSSLAGASLSSPLSTKPLTTPATSPNDTGVVSQAILSASNSSSVTSLGSASSLAMQNITLTTASIVNSPTTTTSEEVSFHSQSSSAPYAPQSTSMNLSTTSPNTASTSTNLLGTNTQKPSVLPTPTLKMLTSIKPASSHGGESSVTTTAQQQAQPTTLKGISNTVLPTTSNSLKSSFLTTCTDHSTSPTTPGLPPPTQSPINVNAWLNWLRSVAPGVKWKLCSDKASWSFLRC